MLFLTTLARPNDRMLRDSDISKSIVVTPPASKQSVPREALINSKIGVRQ